MDEKTLKTSIDYLRSLKKIFIDGSVCKELAKTIKYRPTSDCGDAAAYALYGIEQDVMMGVDYGFVGKPVEMGVEYGKDGKVVQCCVRR